MNDNEFSLIMAKRLIVGGLALATIFAGCFTVNNFRDDTAKVAEEQAKAEAAKAGENRAMWEKMAPAKSNDR